LLLEKYHHGRDRRDDRRGSRDGSSRDDLDRKKTQTQALQAAITAAAVEAYRIRKEPGGFTAEKLVRIAGAAIAAGGLDVIIDRNPNSGSLRHIAEAVVGGLATSKTVGPRMRYMGEGGIRGKAKEGLVAAAAGKVAERRLGDRSRSRGARRELGGSSRRTRSLTPPRRSTTSTLASILKGAISGR